MKSIFYHRHVKHALFRNIISDAGELLVHYFLRLSVNY